MNTIVQEVLKKEEMMRKNLEAQLLQEREAMAMNMIAETNEVVEALGCQHLIANNSITTNITINKGKVVEKVVKVEVPVEKTIIKEIEVPGEIQVVEDMTKIEQLLDEKKALLAEIEKLKKTVATMQRTIAQLKSEKKGEIKVEEKKEEKQEIKKEIVSVKKTDVNMKSSHVGLYQTDRCFLIASQKNDAITWLSNVELTDNYKKQIEELLIANHGLMPSRVKTSPVMIHREDAYMARVEAVNNVGNNFSADDKLSGYVKLDKEFYLYTYQPSKGRAYVDSLTLKLLGEYARPEEQIELKVQELIKSLYADYQSKCKALIVNEQSSLAEAKAARNAKRAARDAQRAAFNVAPNVSTEAPAVDNAKTSTVKSKELQKYVDIF